MSSGLIGLLGKTEDNNEYLTKNPQVTFFRPNYNYSWDVCMDESIAGLKSVIYS